MPTTFSEYSLNPSLQRAIGEMGFSEPSPIQAQTLPILLGAATDFVGLAGTGTGKTAAFAIPLLQAMCPKERQVQALILCPTRELAVQVSGQVNLLAKYMGLKSVAIYGGSSFGDQVYALKQGAAVVVGTPGRVMDHLKRGTLQLGTLKTVILDEADEMVSMGFKDELESILKEVPRESSNVWLFSATMAGEVRRVADTYLREPQQVQINRREMLSQNVEQLYYIVRESDKPEVLCKLIEAAEDFYGLIFCQTKVLVNDLSLYLSERGYKVACLHGDIDQSQRERTLAGFRARKVQMLVCTDVAARGLDVQDITHVVNFSLPKELDSYVHRIGRTARSGKSGVALSLVQPSGRRIIERIEHLTRSRMQQGQIPSNRDIAAKKISALLPRFTQQTSFSRAAELLEEPWKQALAEMSPEEVAARLLAVFMPELLVPTEAPRAVPKRDEAKREYVRTDATKRTDAKRPYTKRGDSKYGDKKYTVAKRPETKRTETRRPEKSPRPAEVKTSSKPRTPAPRENENRGPNRYERRRAQFGDKARGPSPDKTTH